MDDLYRDAADKEGVESAFVFNDNALQRALKRIYEKNFHPMTDIEEDLFNETFRIITKATDEGLSMSSQEVDVSFRQKLDYNNAVFSAFKVHRMQNDIASHSNNGKRTCTPCWTTTRNIGFARNTIPPCSVPNELRTGSGSSARRISSPTWNG